MKDLFFKFKKKFFIFFGIYVFLFFSFPLIVHAEGETISPSPSPSPISVPTGYTSFGSLFNVGESNIFTMDNTNCSELPTGFINPCSWNDGSFGSNMFDEDLSNGEIILPDSVLTANINGLAWSDQAQDFVSTTFNISDFPFYYISRNTQYDTFDIYLSQNLPFEWSMSNSGLIGYRQISGSDTEYTSYDLGDVYLICTAFYDNDPNVYVMDLAQPQNVRYPLLDHLGQLRNFNTGEWEFDVYWGNYGLNTLFASNNGSIWTINPSERNGGTTLFYFSDENNNNIESDVLGPPHIQISHNNSGGDDSLSIDDINNQDYIFDGSIMFVSGNSVSDCNLNVAIDFPSGAIENLSDYSYVLNMSLEANYEVQNKSVVQLPNHDNLEVSLASYYGSTIDHLGLKYFPYIARQNLTFTGSYSHDFTSNCFSIPCSVYNNQLIASYNAIGMVGLNETGSKDFVVSPTNLCNYMSNLPIGSYLSFNDVITNLVNNTAPFDKLTIPVYKNTNKFVASKMIYTFNMDIYHGDKKITSIPLGCEYNVLTGTNTQTTNPGYDKTTINNEIDNNNNNKQPTDPDFVDPSNNEPTIDQTNPNNSNNNNVNASIVINNNPTFNNNVGGLSTNEGSLSKDGGIVRKITSLIVGNNKLGDDVLEDTGTNNYFQVVSDTFSFVPENIFTPIVIAVSIMMGILVIAFIIRIILDLL